VKLRNRFGTFIAFGLITLRADQVTNWNLVATTGAFDAGQAPPVQTRTCAIVRVAIHDALDAIDRRNVPYALETRAAQEASPTAALAAAARDTLIPASTIPENFPPLVMVPIRDFRLRI